MGAFRYCVHCKHDSVPLPKPDALEDLIKGQLCPVCEKTQPSIYSKEEWIIMAFDEIKELKEIIQKQHRKVKSLQNQIKKLKK